MQRLWKSCFYLRSLLFDDIAAVVEPASHPSPLLGRLALPDRILVLVQPADAGIAAVFDPPPRLIFGEAVGSWFQHAVPGIAARHIRVARSAITPAAGRI